MAQVSPSFSTLETDRRVYHNNDRCAERNSIEESNLVHGHIGGRPLCENCEQLNAQDVEGLPDPKA
jgi:hypothetical protein